eukprot:CAMPEP_0170547754 /NCGR_PEP_ID=MMETSP0211-20121228/6095_1 /TAXON_ID=311385 /ORGANISM="Pseudokeronopsis sp., Strain OXSARD2" /LENGTH=36 /DNA_ID= /DNA_START= /DNA_END= /DNA_ORIENTATION=
MKKKKKKMMKIKSMLNMTGFKSMKILQSLRKKLRKK